MDIESIMETIGERIYKLRKKAGFSQEELGYKIGVSRQAVSQWETNTLCPKSDKIKALCEIFNVNADYFLLEEKESMAIADVQTIEVINNNEIKEENHIDDVTNGKSWKITKILALVSSGIIALILVVSIVLIGLFMSTQRGDYTSSSIMFGLTRTGMIILVSVIAFVFVLLTILILIYLIKKTKK